MPRTRLFARLSVATSVAVAIAGQAVAQTALPFSAPVPTSRPYEAWGAAAPVPARVDATMTTASVATQSVGVMGAELTAGGNMTTLKGGLDAIQSGNVGRARAARDSLPARSLDHAILTWAIAISGADGVSSTEIAQASQELAGWPGVATLRNNSERAMYREKPGPQVVLRAFGESEPQTLEGAIVLTRALIASNQAERARAVLAPFWRSERMETAQEVALIREFGRLLPASVHRQRMEQMMHHDRIASAERVASLAGATQLHAAWAAVIREERNAGRLLEAVPQAQRTSGYHFAKARYLRRAERFKEAAQAILAAEANAGVDQEAWWFERRVLSRELLDIGEAQLAYRVAAAQQTGRAITIVDANFHAGWYALRAVRDAATAQRHFARIIEVADGPISRARGHYWLGRAAEAGAPGNARAHYQAAANHGTTFYGQLAAAKLGANTINAAFPGANDADRRNFENRAAVKAIRRLEQAGHERRADMLYRSLAEQLTSPGELALLAVMAERRSHFLALRVGKWAAAKGLEVGALAHPVGAIPASANIDSSGKALAYAIARQESEFNIGAKSSVGALGLLQLMPGTARDMARKTGLSYSPNRLTTDPAYNATLGAAYLGEQLDTFDGSYILTFAAYNAGPTRARQWVERYGHPSGKDIDTVVDWIERIPFTETRSYVQRVMENYQVYKMRLSGRVDIVADLTRGRAR
jgi:soluble lytic murein transglycosylase